MSEPKCECRIGTIRANREACAVDDDESVIIRCPLCKAAPSMLAMLKRLEWIEEPGAEGRDTRTRCLICQLTKYHGHRPGCELAAVLASAKRER